MYVPRSFAFDDLAGQYDFIDRFGFASVVTQAEHGLLASHVPLLLDRDKACLLGHFARANPHVAMTEGETPCLAIFNGPHAYISPCWYEDPVGVPTWNYSAVQVHGALRLVKDELAQMRILHDLVCHYDRVEEEALMRSDTIMQGMLRGVAVFEIAIKRIEGIHKLSQDDLEVDRANVVRGLRASSDEGALRMADWMVEQGVVSEEKVI